jgi:hypothetical protein
MVLDSATMFPAPPPYKFNMTDKKSDYYLQMMQIKNAVDSLTPEQAHIADFWDDNPFKLNVSGHLMFGTKKFSPPGHWMSIVGIAAEKAKADFPTTVTAFTITAISLFDAFIQCWDAKYAFNTVRPETVINKYVDPNWRPHLQTPPFPEYTCGHSTASAAAAEALTSIFGDNFSYTDTTELEFGIKSRSFFLLACGYTQQRGFGASSPPWLGDPARAIGKLAGGHHRHGLGHARGPNIENRLFQGWGRTGPAASSRRWSGRCCWSPSGSWKTPSSSWSSARS